MDLFSLLADPVYVAKFQKFCGVEVVKPDTCDQQTQTRRQSSTDSEDGNEKSNNLRGNGQTNVSSRIDRNDGDNAQHSSHVIDTNSGSVDSSHSNGFSRSKLLFQGPEHKSLGLIEDMDSKNSFTMLTHSDTKQSVQSPLFSPEWDSASDSGVRKRLTDTGNAANLNNKKNAMNNNNSIDSNEISQPQVRCRQRDDISSCVEDSDSLFTHTPQNTQLVQNQPYTIKYKSLYYLAQFGAFLGNEEFYLTFFPFCIWNLDCLIVRQVGILWCLVMYLGQATKDYLRWPRPPCPPVIRLETHYLQEYSMPSTHAMAGTAIPLYMAYLTVERYQVPVPVAAAVAILWFSITCMSRLYLGVHTILDLLAGFTYAILIFFTFLHYVESWDFYLQTNPWAGYVLLATALALCTVCYPSNYMKSSKGDAVQIVGAVAGCVMGCWIGVQLGLMHEPEIKKPYSIEVPTLTWCVVAALRFVTGVLIVAATHFVTRLATIRLFSYLNGLDGPDKTHPNVITAYKFTTYIIVGGTISLLIPLIHMYFGVHRPAVFHEVL